MMEVLKEPETWVAVAFVLFIGVIIYLGAHKKIIEALDHRSARIKAELDEARRLRDEAATLLADYQRKQREAETEAEAIVADAKAEAERVAAESRVKMEEFVARRTKLAESKIGLAEAQALADVRAAAAEAAVTAAEKILRASAKGQIADNLVARGIQDLKAKLN
jgi:F-type H+-transporting ATPase subunit b